MTAWTTLIKSIGPFYTWGRGRVLGYWERVEAQQVWVWALLSLYGLVLVVVSRSLPSLHVDEGFQIELSRWSVGEIAGVLRTDVHPPLYSYLLHVWLRVFGVSVGAARSLSILTTLATMTGLYKLIRLRASRGVAVSGVAIYGSFAMTLVYGMVARNYALLLCILVWLTYYVCQGWARAMTRGRLLGLVALQLGLVYTHNAGVFVLAAGYIFLALARPSWDRVRYYGTALGVTLLLFAPWMWVVLGQLSIRAGESGWLDFEWWRDWANVFNVIAPKKNDWQELVAIGYGGALYLLTTRVWRRSVTPYARTVAVLLGLLILVMYAVSYRQPVFYERYLTVTLPWLAYLLAYSLPQDTVRRLGVVLLIVVCNLGLYQQAYPDFRGGDFYDIEYGLYARDPGIVTVIDTPTYYYHLRTLGYENVYLYDPERESASWTGDSLLRPEDYLRSVDLGAARVQYLQRSEREFEGYFEDNGYRVLETRETGGRWSIHLLARD